MREGFGFVRAVGLFGTLTVTALHTPVGLRILAGGGPDQFLLVAGIEVLVAAAVGFAPANRLGCD